ncbi:MAG: hypothetical protein ACLQF0_09120 [Dissulfurispiraceae bacterium]
MKAQYIKSVYVGILVTVLICSGIAYADKVADQPAKPMCTQYSGNVQPTFTTVNGYPEITNFVNTLEKVKTIECPSELLPYIDPKNGNSKTSTAHLN